MTKGNDAERAIRKRITEIEHNIESCRDRVRDLEWEIEMDDKADDSIFDARRRTIDKIKYLSKDLLALKLSLIEVEK